MKWNGKTVTLGDLILGLVDPDHATGEYLTKPVKIIGGPGIGEWDVLSIYESDGSILIDIEETCDKRD